MRFSKSRKFRHQQDKDWSQVSKDKCLGRSHAAWNGGYSSCQKYIPFTAIFLSCGGYLFLKSGH